jgi:hypothetical protein
MKVNELFNDLKRVIVEQFGEDAVKAPDVVTETFATVKTVDGVEVTIEGELAVGSKATVQMPEGEIVPAPEGAHTLEDGTVIVIVDGLIAEINPKVEEAVEGMEDAQVSDVAALSAKVDELIAKIDALEAKLLGAASTEELNAVKSVANATFKVVEELVNVPAEPVKQSFKTEKQRENRLIKLSETLKNL